MIDLKTGDILVNTKNGSTGEIYRISRDGMVTVLCYEKILGFFKTTDKPIQECATRTIHIKLLNEVIEGGLLKFKDDSDNMK